MRIAHNGRVGQETRTAWKSLPPLNFFPKFTRRRNNRRQEHLFLSCDLHGLLHAPCEMLGASQANTPALHFVIASGAVTNTRRRASFTFHGSQTKYEIRRQVFHAWPLSETRSCQPEIQCPFFLNSISALPGLY